nr:hypothetical protein [Pseudofrankia sp. DC12]
MAGKETRARREPGRETPTRAERARDIALFRYLLVREAGDPSLTSRQRGELVRQIAEQEHTGPDGRPVRVTRWTLDRLSGPGGPAGSRR